MLLTTTQLIEGHPVREYRGLVSAEAIIGSSIARNFKGSLRDAFGGRATSYEEVMHEAKDTALRELEQRAQQLGANAIVGISLDYEIIGTNGSMLLVSACGTAVVI